MSSKFFKRSSCRAARLLAAAFASVAAFVLMASLPARADVYWTLSPSQTGDWSVATNWGGTLPTSSDNAWIVNGGTATISSTSPACQSLYLGTSAGSGALQITTGRLSASQQYVGYSGTGTVMQSGGANTTSYLTLANNASSKGNYTLTGSGQLSAQFEYCGNEGPAGITQSGGTNTVGYGLYVGAFNPTGVGSYDLYGPSQLSAPTEYVGYWYVGTFTQSGGTNTAGNLYLGYFFGYGSNGSYSLSGAGQLSVSGSEYVGYNQAASGSVNAVGTFTQSGGTNTAGSLALACSGGSGTYNLNGGQLVVSSISQGSGTAAFDFSGGTLTAGARFSSSVPMTLGTSGGGATFDTAGYAVTLSGLLSGPGSLTKVDSGTLILADSNSYSGGTTINGGTLQVANAGALGTAGVAMNAGLLNLNTFSIGVPSLSGTAGTISDLSNSGSGTTTLSVNQSANTTFNGVIRNGAQTLLALSKSGTGVLTLSGSNTYSGPTTISQGKLVVDGWLTNSAVSVNDGTLGGTGYLRSVTVTANGTLAPGDPQGVLNLSGNLILASGAAMDYELDGFSTDDEISMPLGSLTLSGQQFSDFHFSWTGGFGPGTYTLVNAESITGLGSNTSGTIDGLPATLSVSNNELLLTVVPEPSTLALLGAGVAGLIGWAWRLRQVRNHALGERSDV